MSKNSNKISRDKKEIKGIWKYLHHLFSGSILLCEGIVIWIIKNLYILSILFILIGLFLIIDDIFAEVWDKSLVGKIESDPIRLKIIGIVFFLAFEIFFVIILIL